MANKQLFQEALRSLTLTKNEAGGVGYARSPRAALAQFAATGCLNATYYASAEQQLEVITTLSQGADVTPEFVARTALYARERGRMKDVPAVLCAVLSKRSPGLLAEVFDRVIDDARMLRTFVQVMRSGAVGGRKSLGTLPKRLVQQWFEARTDEQLFRASVGNDPSLADVIRMTHPRPLTPSRSALYGYLLGKPHDAAALPAIVIEFEAFKADSKNEAVAVPDVPFQMLTGLELSPAHWKSIAEKGSWQMTRMNLNTFARHGVFEDAGLTARIAERLRDPTLVERAKAFPYQLMVAFTQVDERVPAQVREALQDAMEVATRNVPTFGGKVFVLPDVSGSMHSPVTGHRKGATTAVRCVDVAALVAACVLRNNRDAEVVPFKEDVIAGLRLNPRDSVMTNAKALASLPPGGTNCSAPLRYLNAQKARGDLVIFVSDNESWVDAHEGGRGTATMAEWKVFKARNPAAKLVCIDIQPYQTTQADDVGRPDVMNVGGFGDAVFDVVASFAKGELTSGGEHWVKVIENVSL